MTALDWIKLTFSVIIYIPKFFIVVFLKALTVVLSPILALKCFVRWEEEYDVTGYPSMIPGRKCAFLIAPLMGFQTHDDTLDHYWWSNKSDWMREKGYDQEYYDTHEWFRWLNRVLWLCRNPAYQFADWLGWNNKDVVVLKKRDEDSLWKSGEQNFSYWIVQNGRKDVSFLVQGQFYYYKDYCIEFVLGYGWDRWEPDDRCMLNCRIIPFRKYIKM